MIPSFTIGARTFTAYSICAVIGLLVAGVFAVKKTKKQDELEIIVILIWSTVGVMIGGSLLYGITNIKQIIADITAGESIFKIAESFGGSVFYGGLLGGIAAALIYCRVKHIDIKKHVDVAAMAIPLFHAFGRLGCFLSGCCFGMESEIGFIYHYSPIEAANGVRRFPVQLIEAVGELVIFLLLYILCKKGLFKKGLLSVYLIVYPVMRFTLEFFRGDHYRGFLFGLSTSQIISIFLFIYGMISLIVSLNKKGTDEPTEQPIGV